MAGANHPKKNQLMKHHDAHIDKHELDTIKNRS
jgi:hypothetical protein